MQNVTVSDVVEPLLFRSHLISTNWFSTCDHGSVTMPSSLSIVPLPFDTLRPSAKLVRSIGSDMNKEFWA